MIDIDIDSVGVKLSNKRIVDCASIHVDEGEFVGLIGPNGSGKSTLLKSVYRTLKHDQGEITLGGVPEGEISLRENAKRLSVVAQHNYYNFDFLIEEVVQMGRTPHKDPMEMDNKEDEAIVDDALRLVNMHHMKGRKFSSLSGGEQQRVILARALAQQTPCIVLDEPTNHLDIQYQLEVLDIVKSIGCTALCALHDLNLAAQFCDRIYILKDGRIVGEGRPEDVLTEEMIKNVYGVRCSVTRVPETGLLNIAYFPRFSLNELDDTSKMLTERFAAVSRNYDPSAGRCPEKGWAFGRRRAKVS